MVGGGGQMLRVQWLHEYIKHSLHERKTSENVSVEVMTWVTTHGSTIIVRPQPQTYKG